MINFVQQRRLFFVIAGVLIVLSLVAMGVSAVQFGGLLRIGIDFEGGSLFTIQFDKASPNVPTQEQIREVFIAQGLGEGSSDRNLIIQPLGDPAVERLWQVRSRTAETSLENNEVEKVLNALSAEVAPVDNSGTSVDTVDATVGAEVTQSAIWAVLVTSLVILAFIVIAFRRVPHAFRYGVASIIAMLINVLVTLGFYALMGILLGWEVNALFLTALLTVIGFSVQDVIVVFDRIRENISRHRGEPFEMIVNRSVMETIHRSLATQLNAMFVMIAILLFGGDSIKPFIATMLVGMLSETFTSICVAVPILVVWEERATQRRAVTA